ncbi:15-hydroxyprostaglandin dehydrogenase [NAD(+)] isoform X2 [Hydra vulgaris]|uniref:15-hydroxyprostaglandin dehydrogenase [NAD(+)] isoform X2 n=1 Tax=Hydra vulgaris TaxID=6087 RepID=UPI0032E9F4C4
MSAFNQIFLITGGSRGLGKGFASAIVQRGGKVIIVDIVKEVGEATEKELNETHPGQCLFYEGDVTDELLMRNIWEDSEKKLDAKIGVLVNNAGIFNAADWKKTMNINLENYGVKVAALCPTFSDTQMIKENTLVDMMKSSNMVPLTVEKVANDFIRLLEDIYNEKAKNGEIMCVCSKSKYVDENKFDLRELILPVSE